MKFLSIMSVALLMVSACTVELSTPESTPQSFADGINVIITAPDFINRDIDTKSTVDPFSWAAGDKIGLFSNQIGSALQTSSQLALTLSAGVGNSVAYSSTTGWLLVPGSTFNYFSYYPYSETNNRDYIVLDYTGQTQAANNSTAGLGAYDYMYSDFATATTQNTASFSFHHIGCIVNMKITVPEEYASTTFYHMRLYADTQEFTSTATYSINDILTSGIPNLDRQTGIGINLSFGDIGIQPTKGDINAWLMMLPAQWSGKTITVKLYAAKNNVPTLIGTFIPEVNQTAGTKYSYSLPVVAAGQVLPDKPITGEQLHILLFGHSFGVDCTEYLPYITRAEGITDVHYSRFYQSNAALWQHWQNITNKLHCRFYDNDYRTGIWEDVISKEIDDVLAQYPWDIILFQQCIGFSGEGSYSSYQPHLNYLTHYVDSVCTMLHGKAPIIGWNMFWGYNDDVSTAYDIGGATGARAMMDSIIVATKTMVADGTKANDIPLIVPAGTALQNARGTSLNDPGSAESPSTTQLLTRDGYHASYGIGRYVTACTWFQYLIAPIYGTTITDNSYRPTATSFEKDLVTDERAAICWQCAIEAVNHPYEVKTIDENQ